MPDTPPLVPRFFTEGLCPVKMQIALGEAAGEGSQGTWYWKCAWPLEFEG